MLRSREGIPTKGLNSTMRMSFDLRTQHYFNSITGIGPHIPVVLLGDMASLPLPGLNNTGAEGIGPIFGNLSGMPADKGTSPQLIGQPIDPPFDGNLTAVESFRNSKVWLFGSASQNYTTLTDQTYHVEIRSTPVLQGVGQINNRISYRVTTTPGGALVAGQENFIDTSPPANMHGGWLMFAVLGGKPSEKPEMLPFDVWFENLKVDYSLTVGADGLPIGNDLLATFGGSSPSLQIRKNNGAWSVVNGISPPLRMANGDIDADGVSDVLMDFGPTQNGGPIRGLKLWKNGGASQLENIHSSTALELTATDLDANGKTDFVVNFGSPIGYWAYKDSGTWEQLHSVPPLRTRSASLDGDPRRDLVVDFGPMYGIFLRMNNSEWIQLHSTSAEDIVVGDLDNNGVDDIVVDFGSQYGIWIYMNNSVWTPLHSVSANHMVVGNFDSDPRKDVAIDFGPTYGIWVWKNNISWQQLAGYSSNMLLSADLDRNGIDDLIVGIVGGQSGVAAHMNGSPNAIWLTTQLPTSVLAVDADRN